MACGAASLLRLPPRPAARRSGALRRFQVKMPATMATSRRIWKTRLSSRIKPSFLCCAFPLGRIAKQLAYQWARLGKAGFSPIFRTRAVRRALRAHRDGALLGNRAELPAQALHRLGLAAHPEDCAGVAGAFLEHRAGVEDLPAPFLRRPGQEELGLDQALLEEGADRL